jgi:hypothetical protein
MPSVIIILSLASITISGSLVHLTVQSVYDLEAAVHPVIMNSFSLSPRRSIIASSECPRCLPTTRQIAGVQMLVHSFFKTISRSHSALSTSSTSLYHLCEVPILALNFHRRDFGCSSMWYKSFPILDEITLLFLSVKAL